MYQDNEIPEPFSNMWGLAVLLDKPQKYLIPNMDILKTVSFTMPFVINKSIDDGLSLKSRASVSAKLLLKLVQHVLFFECTHLEDDKIISLLEMQDSFFEAQKKQLELSAKIYTPKIKKGNTKSYAEIEMEKLLPAESRVEQFKKVNRENELILCCKCKVSKNVWTGRDCVELNSANLPAGLLNREHLVSKEVAKQNEQNVKEQQKKTYEYLLECYIASNTPEPSILVNFRPLQKDDFNSTFGIFLKDYIPKIMSSPEI